MSASIEIERLNRFEDIDADSWDRLVHSSTTRSVFQTHAWHTAWWQTFGAQQELVLLRATDDSGLVGLLALAVDRDGVVRFVGHRESDYVDWICAEDRDDVRKILLQDALTHAGRWKRIDLHNVPTTSPSVAVLEQSGLAATRMQTNPCPTLLIRGHEEFFAEVLRKKGLRRRLNFFLKQEGYRATHLRRAAEILPELDAFFEQHIGRWSNTPYPSLFHDDDKREFYRNATRALDGTGWLRFTKLETAAGPIAFHYGFVYDDSFLWYKPSFDIALAQRSPGEALIKELLDAAAAEGVAEFDFTVGDEEFKRRFTNHVRENLTMTVFRSSTRLGLHRASRGLKQLVKKSPLESGARAIVRRLSGGRS